MGARPSTGTDLGYGFATEATRAYAQLANSNGLFRAHDGAPTIDAGRGEMVC